MLVYQHAATIPKKRVMLFFRHILLHLFNYIWLKPL